VHPGGIELGDDMARHIAPRCLGQHCRGARLIGRGFRVGFAVVQIDVEQMDFVVPRLNCPSLSIKKDRLATLSPGNRTDSDLLSSYTFRSFARLQKLARAGWISPSLSWARTASRPSSIIRLPTLN